MLGVSTEEQRMLMVGNGVYPTPEIRVFHRLERVYNYIDKQLLINNAVIIGL